MGNISIEDLYRIVDKESVEVDALMSKYTTFRIGGPAKYLVSPKTIDEIKDIIKLCKESNSKYYIIGNGSNIIVKDKGYSGLIIKLSKNFSHYKIEDNLIKAMGGILLSQVARIAYDNSLKGLEFASGIPGTLGGAIAMNAGAYGGEMCNSVISAKVLDEDGNVKTLSNKELEFEYRKSKVSKENLIVLEATMELEKGKKEEIQALMEDFAERRRSKQPLEYPSAGSTFKRPEGNYAGKLIMDAGLAGYRIGDAQVSKKHCGFVINTGKATANDIITLMEDVKEKVQDKFGIILEAEVKILD